MKPHLLSDLSLTFTKLMSKHPLLQFGTNFGASLFFFFFYSSSYNEMFTVGSRCLLHRLFCKIQGGYNSIEYQDDMSISSI